MALNVNIGITGDCQNNSSGAISILPTNGVSPYDVNVTSSSFFSAFTSVTAVTLTNLSADTYTIGVIDSSITVDSFSTNFILSSGFCVDQKSYISTCGLNNGALSVSATSISLPITFNLYSQTSGFVVPITANNNSVTFFNLVPDVYYVDVVDYSNCTGRTATCVINNSADVDFDLFTINNSNCTNTPTGKIYVYNESGGVPPYTYLWQPTLETTKSITGLSAGAFTVTVTDSVGCTKTKQSQIIDVPKVGVTGFVVLQPPDCWQSNGVLQMTITGGTAPYLYQLNSFAPKISLSTTEVFSGLSAGVYNLQVTDAGLCYANGSTTLQTPDSFTIVAVNITPSFCNNNSGQIQVILNGGATPYNFELTDFSGTTKVISGVSPVAVFSPLPTGNYHLKITNPSDCLYEADYIVTNVNKFEILTTTSNTTCGGSNGSITIFVNSAGTYSYFIDNQSFLNTNQLSHTFNNVAPGLYNVEVKDNTGCSQKTIVNVGSSSNVNFTLIPSSCGLGNEGTITSIITSGEPPFTYNWSSNVNGQTGIYLTGLTAGTYTLQLIDSNGCSSTKSVDVTCLKRYFSYETYELCDGNFVSSSATKNGIFEMYHQGYLDLISGDTNCKLNTAEFTLKVDVAGTAYTKTFFTTTSLYSYPTDDDYINALKSILQGIDGIGSVIINKNDNTIKVNTDCERTLAGKNIEVDLGIEYYICCVAPTPTPTNTPTITQTPTNTQTSTQTPTNTPTFPNICWIIINEMGEVGYENIPIGTSPVLYNGKVWYGDPIGDNCVYWDDVLNVWVFSPNGLGGVAFQTLDNNNNDYPFSSNLLQWTPDCVNSGGVVLICSSENTICPTPTPTQTPTQTPTNTKTPTQTPTLDPCATEICGETYEGYGYLYNWFAINNSNLNLDGRSSGGIVNVSQPYGDERNQWTVPADKPDVEFIPNTSWEELLDYYGDVDPVIGDLYLGSGFSLKTRCTTPFTTNNGLWDSPNSGVTNIIKFSAIPGGCRNPDGTFTDINQFGYYWSFFDDDSNPSGGGFCPTFNNVNGDVTINYLDKNYGMSIRLVRPATPDEKLLPDGETSNTNALIPHYVGNDGKKYITVKVGNQVWTIQNLMEEEYNDGSPINEVTNDVVWSNLGSPVQGARCSYNNGSITPDQGQIQLCGTPTPNPSSTPTQTPTNTQTPTQTPTPTNTQTPTNTPTPTQTTVVAQSYCVDISTTTNSYPSSECPSETVIDTIYTFTLIDSNGNPAIAPSDVTITFDLYSVDPGVGGGVSTSTVTITGGSTSVSYLEATYLPINGAPGCPCPCPQTNNVDTNTFSVSIALPNTVSYPCCSEYYNGSGGDLTISYIDCFGTVFSNVTIGDGQDICCSQSGLPSGPGSGFLTPLGLCFY